MLFAECISTALGKEFFILSFLVLLIFLPTKYNILNSMLKFGLFLKFFALFN